MCAQCSMFCACSDSKFFPCAHHEGTEVQLHLFLTSTLGVISGYFYVSAASSQQLCALYSSYRVLGFKTEPVLAVLKNKKPYCDCWVSSHDSSVIHYVKLRTETSDLWKVLCLEQSTRNKTQKDSNSKRFCLQSLPDLNQGVKTRNSERNTSS
jgi:hypothetical protein